MSLSALIQRRGIPPAESSMTMTPATPCGTDNPTVATVATVAVTKPVGEETEIIRVEIPIAPAQPSAPARFTETDRRTCRDCMELSNGWCRAASRGEIKHAATQYRPIPGWLHRCLSYIPCPDDPDQRTGPERWPGTARREAAGGY